ncbi:MAG: MFS transporter [Acutalibacteraceae bacterium]
MAQLIDKVKELVSTAKQYWNTPAKGNYVPYKEIATLGVAGFGVHWTSVLPTAIGLDAGNFLVGASIGLKPFDLWIMLLVANIIGIPIAVFRGWYFDNHNMKGGKFIPFIVRSTVPIVLISAVFVWLPYEHWQYITKAVVVEILYLLLQFFLCFYNEGFAYLQQIITPNAQERATVMSISQIIYSLAPTLSGLIIPTISGLTYGLNNIWTYRIIYPIFSVIGVVINIIFFRKVKERLILPKKRLDYIRIVDAVREVAKNKYFWIINSASWIGFLECAYGVILGWSFVYSQNGAHQAKLGLANTIIGNAALWAMLLAPLAIKKFGKRNLLILCNVLNVVLFTVLLFTYKNLFAICVVMFFNGFFNTFGNIYFPNINADMRDYHQWKTGVRIDGLFGPLGLIGTVISFFTGFVLPMIYEKMGLHEDYNVLYDDTLRNNLFRVLIICAIGGAILNLIPYLFYDLTESKHKGYVNVLKIRAMFEDYGNKVLDDDELSQAMEIIHTAREVAGKQKVEIDKSALKAARKLPKKTEEEKEIRKVKIAESKKQIKNAIEYNDNVECMPIVNEELDKFSTLRYQKQLESAKLICESGPLCGYGDAKAELKKAKALAKSTHQEKEIRSDAINLARTKTVAEKLIKKYTKDGITEPDDAVEEEIRNRETASFPEVFRQKRDLKAYLKSVSVYKRATAPYENAKNLIIQAENYTHLDEIEQLYNSRVSSVQ